MTAPPPYLRRRCPCSRPQHHIIDSYATGGKGCKKLQMSRCGCAGGLDGGEEAMVPTYKVPPRSVEVAEMRAVIAEVEVKRR